MRVPDKPPAGGRQVAASRDQRGEQALDLDDGRWAGRRSRPWATRFGDEDGEQVAQESNS